MNKKEALQATPSTIDPQQQPLATVLQESLNHAGVDRKHVLDAIRFVNRPMSGVQVVGSEGSSPAVPKPKLWPM